MTDSKLKWRTPGFPEAVSTLILQLVAAYPDLLQLISPSIGTLEQVYIIRFGRWESDQLFNFETWSGERSAELVSTSETRNPKPETDSEDLTSPGPIETRNPKPETRNRLWRLNFPRADRNPKPETRNRLWRLNFPRADRNPKPETRNPKPETRNRLWRLNFPRADRNPKPETRNPKPTAKVGFNRRNPKPETRNRQRKLVSIDETRNPKPETRNRLESDYLGGSPDRNSPFPISSGLV